MQVRLKLMGTLRAKSPPGDKLELPDGATVADALNKLDIDAAHIQVVMVNGKHERDFQRTLADDDELMVLSPVGGG